jgi:2-haloacid dehalogenase
MNGIRALVFDTFGTLVDWRGGMIAHLSSWGDARGIRADWPAFVDAWRMDYPPSLDRVRRGERAWANLDVLHRESFERLAPKFGVPAQDGEGLNALARFWHELPAWPDVVGGLHRLKPRYMIAPLSNGHVALLVSMSKSLGLPWDMIFGADLFRHYKPDPETYLGAAALFGCAPGEVIMVASHPSDLAAAARYGLRTCYVSRRLEYGEGRIVEPEPTPGTFDLMVDGVDELADVLLR